MQTKTQKHFAIDEGNHPLMMSIILVKDACYGRGIVACNLSMVNIFVTDGLLL